MSASDSGSVERALAAVRETTQRRAAAETRYESAVREQTEAIRTAIADGVSTLDLATETGMSRARIYQIRDGRR
jgi:hypothetical protein